MLRTSERARSLLDFRGAISLEHKPQTQKALRIREAMVVGDGSSIHFINEANLVSDLERTKHALSFSCSCIGALF
ncbi:hypothetical protein CaCOL14_013141 [Colletotrichum acutatum]